MKHTPKKHATAKHPKKPKLHAKHHPRHTAAKKAAHHKKAAKTAHAHKLHKTAKKPKRAKAAPGLMSREAYTPDAPDDRDHVYTAPSCRPEFVDLSATL